MASLLMPGCASVQRAILEASTVQEDVTNTIPGEQNASAGAAAASANANPEVQKPAPPQSPASPVTSSEGVPRSVCDRNKALRVGMTVAQVYASCWGRPKSVNVSVMGSTRTEMLLYEGYNYVYAENGIVKSIETSGR